MASNLDRFSMKQLMELDACTRCGECLKWCEAYSHTGDDLTGPALKLKELRGLLMDEQKTFLLSRLFDRRDRKKEWMQEFAAGVYRCTMCARCVEVCPVKIDLLKLWFSMREEMVFRQIHPANLNQARKAVAEHHNVVAYPNDERALWVDYLVDAPEDLYQRDRAEVLYFVGCMSSFSPAIQGIPQAYAQLLDKAGVDFTILGDKEWCCGFPLKAAGMRQEAEEVIKHNVQMVEDVGARVITFNCPSCYNTWIREYAPHLPGVEFLHSSQFILRLIQEGRIALKKLDKKLTYHDPCDLGRNSGVYDPPREVLRSIPGVQYVESEAYKEKAHCCGGGGDLEIVDADLAKRVAQDSYASLLRTGAEAIVTACPQCTRMFRGAKEKAGGKAEVWDMTELVLNVLKEG